MTEIIGPYDHADFLLMRDIKGNIDYCVKKDYTRFELSIKKHKAILKEYFSKRWEWK